METSVLAIRSHVDDTAQCPFCREPMQVVSSVKCSVCGTAQHEGCWIENYGQCTVFQCSGIQAPAAPEVSRKSLLLSAALLLLPAILILTGVAPTWVFPAHALALIALAFFMFALLGG